jgi:hypothetical protein
VCFSSPTAIDGMVTQLRDGGSEGAEGAPASYCVHNKGTPLQSPLKFSAINECLGVEEGVHTLNCNGALFQSPLKFSAINKVFLVSRSERRCSVPYM